MYIHVTVRPDAKKETFEQTSPDHFVITVREKAERNMANTRVVELIKQHFHTSSVRIINGHHSRSKLLSVD